MLSLTLGGAYSDLQKATSDAEMMVKQLGMSEKLGLRVIPDKQAFNEGGTDLGPAMAELVDSEINRLLQESYKRAVSILKSHKTELDQLADALMRYETLDADDVKAIIDGDHQSVHKRLQEQQQRQQNMRRNGSDRGMEDDFVRNSGENVKQPSKPEVLLQ